MCNMRKGGSRRPLALVFALIVAGLRLEQDQLAVDGEGIELDLHVGLGTVPRGEGHADFAEAGR